MTYGPAELASSFRTVRGNTIQIAEEIPEDKYGFTVAEGTRSIEKLLTHIALGYRFQHQVHAIENRSTLAGMNFPALFEQIMADEAKPRTKAEVLDLLRTEGEKWAKFAEGVTHEFLTQSVAMPEGMTPAAKSRLEMMLSVKEHEMHHRGQLMLIQRMLGIVPHLTRQMNERMAQAHAQSAKT